MLKVKAILSKALLLLRCLLHYMQHGKANVITLPPKSVVIIQRGKLGDMIVTTAMFRAIKKAYPQCRVTVVGDAVNKKVLEGNQDVDAYIFWSGHVKALIERLKLGTYDFGCLTGPNFDSIAALYLSGVKAIAAPVIKNGWSPYETKSYKLIRNFAIPKEHWMKKYVPREYLKLLEPIGIHSEETKKYIYWTPEGENKAQEIVGSVPKGYEWLVGIMPGAGNKPKQWPAERFGEVADYLIEKYSAHILIIGSSANREEINAMLGSVKNKERVTDTSTTTIDEVKALIPKLDFTVSVDTGPVFIAEATGVPTIDITGAIHPDEMAPNDGDRHLVVLCKGEPQIWTMNARVFDYEEARRQIEGITIGDVTNKIDELIAKLSPKARISQ